MASIEDKIKELGDIQKEVSYLLFHKKKPGDKQQYAYI